MKDFLITYWRLILEIIVMLITLIFFFIKKKPVNDLKALLYELCVIGVNGAEKTLYKGEEKLNFAVGIVKGLLLARYPDLDFNKYYGLIVSLIENILSTPSKKGATYEN